MPLSSVAGIIADLQWRNQAPALREAESHQAYGVIYGMVMRQAMVLSYIDNFRMLAFLCFLCVPAVFLFKRVRAKKGPVSMH